MSRQAEKEIEGLARVAEMITYAPAIVHPGFRLGSTSDIRVDIRIGEPLPDGIHSYSEPHYAYSVASRCGFHQSAIVRVVDGIAADIFRLIGTP